MRIAFAAALLTCLTGCAGLTPQGLLQAMRFDPLTTDPTVIEVAAALDEAVELSADGLQIAISFNADEDGALLVSEVVALEVTETLSLPGDIRAAEDQRLWRARFPDEGAARFSAAQAAILELREADVQGTGSLSITVGQGCTGDRVPDTLSFRSWLRMDAGGAFIPFSRSDDLFALMDEAEAEALRRQLTASC
ncbi:hypothetical protein [Pontivivens insulae]|uniref:Lipoprotein n=1 Tax=Pontivivens insulae TaxID=1639689 RepID=A0A2R8AG30_9RHOB|nr:hypothetical protein [Pontivivens insulae]RED12291.1 hypothetical protein DFR53_3010 [Pontivivens insulae]SPF31048.1 hypothetical protein POI8812_03399 [Pontivivens insulae]